MRNRAALMARSVKQAHANMTRMRAGHLGELRQAGVAEQRLVDSTNTSFLADEPESVTIGNLKAATDAFQAQKIQQALTLSDYNWSQAARALQMDRANLVRLAKRLGIKVTKQLS